MSTQHMYIQKDLVDNPRGVVLITHGLGEHSGRYDDWVLDLNRADISVLRYDLPGHGRSRKGDWLFEDFEVLVAALESQYTIAMDYSEAERVPLFLFGHSMGGLITADFVTRFSPKTAGVILSAPALDAGEIVKPWMIRMAGLLRKVLPGLPVLSLPPEQLARDPEVVTGYKKDPLVYHGKIKVKTGYELLSRMEVVKQKGNAFHHSLLMVQGQSDQIVRPEVAKTFFDQVSAEDKSWHSFAGMYHEVLHDIGNEKVKAVILKWVDQRM